MNEVMKTLVDAAVKESDSRMMDYFNGGILNVVKDPKNCPPQKEIKLEDDSELAKRLREKYGKSSREIIKNVVNHAYAENMRNFHKKQTRTDLQKWETFLIEMGIPFKVIEQPDYDMCKKEKLNALRLYIGVKESLKNDLQTEEYFNLFDYGTEFVSIVFDEDGSFVYFSALGR